MPIKAFKTNDNTNNHGRISFKDIVIVSGSFKWNLLMHTTEYATV